MSESGKFNEEIKASVVKKGFILLYIFILFYALLLR